METIILDYCNWKVYTFSHDKSFDTEKMELVLTEKYKFRLDEIEWMTVDKIKIESL